LKRYASLEMQQDPDGQVLVEVMVDQTPRWMLVDTGGATSELTEEVVNELHLKETQIAQGLFIYAADGSQLTHWATVPTLEIGLAHFNGRKLLASPPSPSWAARHIAGVLAPDILSKFDLDFDFQQKKLNLFSQDHCEGKVVYWSGSYAVMPFELSEDGHIKLDLSLDGKRLRGVLDTGANVTTLLAPEAHALFGIDKDSPGVTGDGPNDLHVQLHELSIGGVSVQNPDIHLMDDAADRAYRNEMGLGLHELGVQSSLMPKMLLGTNVLRHLHLYVAYQEHEIYVTAAEAK
jgi:predicted aspartyl protease